jgi:hypothetical protein
MIDFPLGAGDESGVVWGIVVGAASYWATIAFAAVTAWLALAVPPGLAALVELEPGCAEPDELQAVTSATPAATAATAARRGTDLPLNLLTIAVPLLTVCCALALSDDATVHSGNR